MTVASRFKQADLTRALRGAAAAGIRPSGAKIDVDGSIHLLFADAPSSRPLVNPLDRFLKS